MSLWKRTSASRPSGGSVLIGGVIIRFISFICVVLALLIATGIDQAGWCAGEHSLSANTTWSRSEGPHIIEGDLRVPPEVELTITPGTEVLFERGASLVIEGVITALGTPEDPILFSSASQGPAPGDWGNLRFITADTTLSYDEEGNYLKGSRLEHCIIEYGGQPAPGTPNEFLGGAIHCRKSSPYLSNLVIRYNSSLQGGGVYCHEFASPYISNCLFMENDASESGGGLSCFFYSNAVVKDNVFHANRTEEHGGGIYFSFSSPQIIGNIIENNSAGVHGGGLHCSNTVTQAISRVRGNVLLSNRSKYKANSIYLTAKIETIFQGNCFLAGEGYDVYIDALEEDLDLRGNYFGPPSRSDLEAKIYDSYDDPSQMSVICDPVLESPPAGTPNAPEEISFFDLFGDEAFSIDWPLPLCDEAPIYLEARAQDRNPYHADWIPIRLRSSASDPQGIVVLAWETGPSSGIFRFQGQVATASIPREGAIKARPGEILFCSIEGVEGFEISRPVHMPKSYIVALGLPEEADSLHVVDHEPVLSWAFRDIFGRRQEAYQIQVSRSVPFAAPPLWDGGELMGSATRAVLRGVTLEDGATYGLRLRMYNSTGWSDWAELTSRMNSLPTVPEPLSPQNGKIVDQIRPEITLRASTDAEGDPITYELQLCKDAEFQRVIGIDKEVKPAGDAVRWAVPTDLADDAEYYWRARSRDTYETGPWTSTGQFWVNLVEEAPLPFGLLGPEPGIEIYLLQPVLSWEETFDPDPLSEVHYRLSISRDPKFSEATTVALETDMTFVKYPRVLKNEATYYWKVEAVDNTGRTTPSDQVGNFYVCTTPTVPELLGPLAGEELRPGEMIAWNPSRDPDPDDLIEYRLQVTKDDFGELLLEEVSREAGMILENLEGYSLLIDNEEYHVRVRAEDNHDIASKWSEPIGLFFFNKVNDPPEPVAEPITPDSGVVTDPEPVLQWGAARDADRSDPQEKLSYILQFDQGGGFQGEIKQVQVMAGATQVAVPGLADNQEWFYRICARDDEGALSEWSPVKSFVLNTKNDPPQPFVLSVPDDGMETYMLSEIEFTWEGADDPDPGDKVHYLFHIVRASDGAPIVEAQRTDDTSWRLNITLENEVEYTWWVEAEDEFGLCTPSSEKFRFFINTTPSVPVPEQIADEIVTGGETFQWGHSTDPDPRDLLTYELRIISPEDPEKSLLNVKDISAVEASSGISVASLEGLSSRKDDLRYAFCVRAQDQHGAISAWSDLANFFLDLANEPPAAPALVEPSNELTREKEVTVRWLAAEDPDPSDRPETISYLLQAVLGQDFDGGEVQERELPSGVLSLEGLQLEDNQLWSLRVRAEDARGGISDWSAPQKLLVNVSEDPPSPPQILGPENGSVWLTLQPVELSWSASEDPDYDAVVHYEIRWWPEGESDNINVKDAEGNTSYTLEGLAGDKDYNWRIFAFDETGLESHSKTGSFRVEIPNHPPQPFDLLMPDDGQDELPALVEFSWEAAVDNDPGDDIRYTLYLAKDVTFGHKVKTYSDLVQTKVTLTESLEEGTTYYWKVVAQDRKGLQVWGSDSDQNAFRFTVEVPPEIKEEGEGDR